MVRNKLFACFIIFLYLLLFADFFKTNFLKKKSFRMSEGAMLSGRVLDFRSWSCWFELHLRHCVVSFSKTLYPLLIIAGSTKCVRQIELLILESVGKVNLNFHGTTV